MAQLRPLLDHARAACELAAVGERAVSREDVAKFNTRALRHAPDAEVWQLIEALKKSPHGTAASSLWWFLDGLRGYRSAVCSAGPRARCACPWVHLRWPHMENMAKMRESVRQMRRAERELTQCLRGKGRRVP